MKYLKSALVDAHTADPGTTGLLTFAQRGSRNLGDTTDSMKGSRRHTGVSGHFCHWDKHPRETKGGKLYSGSEVSIPARVAPLLWT